MDMVKANEILSVIEQLNPDSRESILKALKLAEHVEETSMSFYRKEEEKTRGNELGPFFEFMIKEEEMHLTKVREMEEKVSSKEELENIDFQRNVAPQIHAINAGQSEMTAILYALWREKLAEDFYRKASEKTSGTVSKFFVELADFEKGHVELLQEYVEGMQNADELIMG